MVNWLAKLKVGDLYKAYSRDEISIEDIANGFAERLKEIPAGLIDGELMDIIAQFEDVHTIEGFDNTLDNLYDWADDGHRLWVNTY